MVKEKKSDYNIQMLQKDYTNEYEESPDIFQRTYNCI